MLVVAAIDGKAFASWSKKAAAQGVPVIAYDRLINSSPLAYYVSFDSVVVGKVEAGWMAKHTKHGRSPRDHQRVADRRERAFRQHGHP